MKRNIFKIFAVLMVLALVAAPASAKEVREDFANTNPPGMPTELSSELLNEFQDGMTIEEFLVRNQGPIPNALLEYADLKVTVIVQMEQPSLIEYIAQVKSSPANMPASNQQSYVLSLQTTQGSAIASIEKLGGQVMGQYTKTINGFMARISAKDLNAIRSLPGVKEISQAPQHEIALSHSVPLINADDVWAMPGAFDGDGITVAVIDTGIDYTHAMFGGSGDPDDYSNNNPNIIEGVSFPTAKVKGGYDFAGTNYDASSDDPLIYTPIPDPDPLDENGHGTHVASTIAGDDVGFGSGVAPGASLYALKVFGKTGTTNLVLDAIEWAMDPNDDGDTSDHVDVLNISVDSVFGAYDANDPVVVALEAASALGVFVVAPAGNGGNSSYIVGSPSVSDSALSVAASSTGYQTVPYIVYDDGIENDKKMPYTPSDNPFISAVTREMIDVTTIEEIASPNGEFCDITGIVPNALSGNIALISAGTCTVDQKINNAETLGADAVIIYNDKPGILTMYTPESTLPAGSILQSDGVILKGLAPFSVTVGPDTTVFTFDSPYPADSIAKFSARGPRGFDSKLKPEITAPGVSIVAAKMGGGDTGVPMSGTSMAAPHVAGVAALIKEAHPSWTSEQIKAAIMNTAVDLSDTPGEIPRQGAGRVDAYAALNTDVVAIGDPKLVSLSWGLIEVTEVTYQSVKTVTLHNFTGSSKTLNVTTLFNSASAGATLTPSISQVVVPANGSISFDVTLNLIASDLPLGFGGMEEYYGFVKFSGDEDLRVPFYFVPRPYTQLTEDDSETTFDIENGAGFVNLTQSGPHASKLNAYPVFLMDEDEADVLNAGDLRYVGLDYWGVDPTYGAMLVAAFSMWGPVHTNQSYFNEVNLIVDVNNNGSDDYKYFNFNFGAFQGEGDNNKWGVLQVRLSDGYVKTGSPYSIDADFNSGFQAWYLPAAPPFLGIVGTEFSYQVKSFDWNRAEDNAGKASYDYAKNPLDWGLTAETPAGTPFSLNFSVNNIEGYDYSQPKGIMLVDYYGKPGIGQVYYWPIDTYYTPVALDQNLLTNEDVPLNITLTGTGLIPLPVVWTIVSDPQHGTLSGSAPNLVYTPGTDWNGTDSFTFSVNNGRVSNIATIEIVVSPVYDLPVAHDQQVSTLRDTPVNITLVGLDPDGGVLTYEIVTDPLHGSLSYAAIDLPDLEYTPDAGWTGTDSFTFKVNDGVSDSNIATVTIDVNQTDWKIFLPLLMK